MSSIVLNNVCLDYILKTGSISIKNLALGLCKSVIFKKTRATLYNNTFRALNNIDLQLKDGDRLGIIGRNGAGKSTLLKVLARIYKPNIGNINIQGKISTLFDINIGVNAEASGYENIITLAIMRGMTKNQGRNITDEIASFTELGDFLKAPVRTYSTGMQMKLAFAIATAIKPEILLIDEIIGAGDFHFMEKVNQRLKNLIHTSNILVLSTHSTEIVNQLCNRVLVLDKGEIHFMGDTKEGIEFYQSHFS